MKAKISELGDWGVDITMEPESQEELLILLRYGNCAKMEKPQVLFSFRNRPYLYLCLKKIHKSKQNNSITKH